MMEQLWNGILSRFGENVVLCGDKADTPVRALVQPLLERGKEQQTPGPMGWERRDRFRYLGPVEHPLDLDTVVEWNGKEYRVQRAHLVGQGVCPHWWAVLCPREETAL